MTTLSVPHDDLPACAGLPHGTVNVSATWCPHRQQWTVSRTEGAAEEPVMAVLVPLGPFDSDADAVGLLTGWLMESLPRIRRLCS